eukprot:CAMPEP_0117045212 /NCGR_PEP_ID=MMETSP0472-20121206/31280_1 /TAXON_ID=693140 ORGANISM="Tiarina fusus, Strain LIS" /NCGR_SAMPLE_ID=MMETSP0472 /ASSEMBLY_ACC=CAM_ASM_000603 /LENGTH=73 /DNA_ID=CAMNT_0004757131 /DNA_START=229 /DNA_END=450 /DNA_ORIENTATION=-
MDVEWNAIGAEGLAKVAELSRTSSAASAFSRTSSAESCSDTPIPLNEARRIHNRMMGFLLERERVALERSESE